MSECNCSMRQQLVGDGCHICNPEVAKDLSESDLVDDLLNFFEQREGEHISDVDIEGVMEKAALRIEELEARELGYIQSLRDLEARVRELDWISVEDRLPEEDGPYLCVIDWGKSKEVKSLWRIDDAWFCHGHNYPEVIKWRPLPKAE